MVGSSALIIVVIGGTHYCVVEGNHVENEINLGGAKVIWRRKLAHGDGIVVERRVVLFEIC